MASLKATANRKIGGMKAWQWAALLGVAILIGVWLRRRAQATADTAGAIEESVVYSTTEDQAIPGTVGGGAGGGGAGYTSSEAPAPTFFPSPFEPEAYPLFTGGGLPSFFPSLGLAPVIDQAPITTQEAASAPVAVRAPAVAPAKQTSFTWSGITYRAGDKAKFQAWLKSHGASYTVWKASHRKAACDVFGDC
jgi:hypothetical protein